MKINIKDKDIELRYSIRSMIMYENIADKSFQPKSLTDVITYMYCVIVSSGKDYSFTFDEFIDYLDENPNVIKEFGTWLDNEIKTNDIFKKNS